VLKNLDSILKLLQQSILTI